MRLPGSTSTCTTTVAQSCFNRLMRNAAAKPVGPSRTARLPFQDESIIAVSFGEVPKDQKLLRSSPSYCYTKEQLLIIKKSPLSSRVPACLDPAYTNSDGKWDPEVYVSYCKLQESIYGSSKLKNRMSLDSGCSISPIRMSEKLPFFESNRRSGSGRISMDSFQEKHYEFDARSHQDTTMERTFSSEDAEEPEWFSSGPTSKHEMIELRGFEDIEEEKEESNDPVKPASEKEKTEKKAGPKGRSTPTSMNESAPKSPKKQAELQDNEAAKKPVGSGFKFDEFFRVQRWDAPSNTSSEAKRKYSHSNAANKSAQSNFNFDDFFNSASSIPVASSNDRSRFSQWFTSHDTSQSSDTTFSKSFEERYLSNLLNISDSSDSSRRQKPQQRQHQRDPESARLFEMLHQNDKPTRSYDPNSFFEMVKNSSAYKRGSNSNVMSLQEVEACMQRGVPPRASPQPKSKKDILAFRKLLSQASSGQPAAALNFCKQFPPAPQIPEPVALVQIQVLDFVRNFLHTGQQNVPARSVINPYFNNNNYNFARQPSMRNYGNDRRTPSKLLHKDSTLYHRRVKLNENN